MAEIELSQERLIAGGDFLTGLERLGLNPDGLCWAFDDAVDELALVLVTSFYDDVGPLEINKLLFRAYNLAVTPRSISPFIIRLHSPRDDVAAVIDRFVTEVVGPGLKVPEPGRESDVQRWTVSAPAAGLTEIPIQRVSIAGTSLHAFGNGLYVWRHPSRRVARPMRWERIARNVEARAA